ncbi:MAG: urease accessory protein UreD [Nitrospiraceae bacterium]|nr:urease accessory protein UreD [Nitrospiraceae bacterium]
MTSPVGQALALDSVGRRGSLSYEFERAGLQTVLMRSTCTSPWHHFPPSYLDDSGCAFTWLVNPSGGLVAGDHMSIEAQLHAETHVFMTSPSANRVYRSLSEPALQEIRLSVGADARLEWVPEITIPFAGSRFRQSIHVDLAPGATVVLWDAMASGRVARHERWAFATFENEIFIQTSRGKSLIERCCVVPDQLSESIGLVGSWDYVASLFIIGDAVEPEAWKRLDEVLATILEERPGLVLGAVSTPALSGLVVKLVARSAPDLTAVQEAMWTAIRKELWSLPAPNLRRY